MEQSDNHYPVHPVLARRSCPVSLSYLHAADIHGYHRFDGTDGYDDQNTIVLVDEADRLIRENGYTIRQAAIEATVLRVRPVFLASFTTIVGMVPLIPDPMYSSLAITIMGGLFIGTIVTLLLLPLLYVILVKDVKSDKI